MTLDSIPHLGTLKSKEHTNVYLKKENIQMRLKKKKKPSHVAFCSLSFCSCSYLA